MRCRGQSARRWVIIGAAVAVFGCAQVASAADSAPDAGGLSNRMLERILACGPRFIGLPGHQLAADLIEQHLRQLEAAGAGQLIVHQMQVVVPVVERADLSLDDAAPHPIYPCWPNGAQLSATSLDGLSGPLCYVGDGHEAQLPTGSLAGAVVALEYNSYDRWKKIFEFGAAAVLFLPPQNTTWVHSHGKFADIPFQGPRFYLQDKDLADAIRGEGRPRAARIVSRMRWAPRPARSFVWVVPGRSEPLSKQVVVLNARYDAACVVPQLAYGAEQAVSAAVLCEVASDLAGRPPARTAVLVWTGADAMNFASLRAILGTAFGKDKDADAALAAARAANELLPKQRSQILNDLRAALPVDDALRDRYEMQIKHLLVPIRWQLRTLRRDAVAGEQAASRIASLSQEQDRFNTLHVALQRNRIDDDHWLQIAALTDRVVAQIDAEAVEAESKFTRLEHGHRLLRPLLARERVVALLAADLTSQGDAFGIYWRTHWQQTNHFSFLSRIARRLVRPRKPSDDDAVVVLPDKGLLPDTMLGRRDWLSDICSPVATAADIAQHFGYLALPLVTAYDGRWLVDSPLDRGERLTVDHIRPQVTALLAVVQRAVNDPKFRITNRLGTALGLVSGQAVVPSPGDGRLNLGQAGRLVTVNVPRPTPRAVGTRWISAQYTSATGSYELKHLSGTGACGGSYLVDVLALDDDGRIVESANHIQSLAPYALASAVALGEVKGVKSIMFSCVQQSVGGLRDPRYLQELVAARPLLKRTGDDPRYGAVRAANGLACILMQPRDRWLLTFSRGQWGIRMLMTGADAQNPIGAGYGFDVPVRSAQMDSAENFYQLNRMRLTELSAHGVTAAHADALQDQTREHLEKAAAADVAQNAGQVLHHHRAALAKQQVVYGHVMSTGNDVVTAVIFLMVVLIPFSFYTERLTISASTIYGRIMGFAVVLVAMMALLYSFHPAFRISMTPLVVLLAFVMIVLSGLVIFILFSRFAEQMRSRLAGEHSTNLARLNVVGKAMEVGVANMRRRKIRTCFTLVTLVVLTFTLLSLSGTRTDLAEKRFRTGAEPTYQGILITRLGWQKLAGWFLEQVQAAYKGSAVVGGQYWLSTQASSDLDPYVVARSPSPSRATYLLTAAMGVGADESRFLSLEPGMKTLFDQLAGDPDGCLLPREAADRLGVAAGHPVRIAGRTFRVCGIYEHDDMARLRYLSGQPYGPIDLAAARRREIAPDPRQSANLEAQEFMLEPDGFDADIALAPVAPHRFALIGAAAARDMGATLHSVCIATDDDLVLDRIANEVSAQRLLPVFRSRGSDVEIIATRSQLSIVGLGDLFIPMVIGALIVINTMINAVADQRSTIHVYTSLGLAPVHVGVLFLSEAAALGTLGVVGGFIVGQGFATIVSTAGFADAVTLNFSSTSVVFTMAMVMGIVLLSAIYPARMAGRIAAPAESRRWQLPPATGNTLRMSLPFTVSRMTAQGASAFLHEWLTLHTEAGVGQFVSDDAAVVHRPADDIQGVRAHVWLAPFDVGVSQEVLIEIAPVTEESATKSGSAFYEVTIAMTRLSGQATAWMRSNRAFVAELRKQFLLWRALTQKRREEYVAESRRLLQSGASVEMNVATEGMDEATERRSDAATEGGGS